MEEKWNIIPLTSGDGQFWDVGIHPAIHRVDRNNADEIDGILSHCKKYPEQWEVLVADTVESTVSALDFAHSALAPNQNQSIMVFIDEDLIEILPDEDKRNMHWMMGDISRMGRSFRVNLTVIT